MIRYVLAVLITVALLALAVPALDHAGGVQTERQLAGELSDLEDAAISLLETEELPHEGVSPPQRTVTITFPADTHTSAPIDRVRIERTGNGSSVVTSTIDGGIENRRAIDVPVGHVDPNRSVELEGAGEKRQFVLRLEGDDRGDPIVTIERA